MKKNLQSLEINWEKLSDLTIILMYKTLKNIKLPFNNLTEKQRNQYSSTKISFPVLCTTLYSVACTL